MENLTKIPVWVTVITAMFFISNLFVFGGLALFRPEIAFPDAGSNAAFPIQFFAIRHIALAVPLLHGLIRKDVKILLVMYTIFFVMTILDVSLLFIKDYYIPIVGELPTMLKAAFGLGAFVAPVTLTLLKLKSLNKQH